MNTILKLLTTAVIAFLLAKVLPGIKIENFYTAMWVAVGLAILNTLLKPILQILTFPITLVTLGLFLFVINACIIMIDDKFIHGFKVDGFWYALLFSICLSTCVSFVYNNFIESKKEEEKK